MFFICTYNQSGIASYSKMHISLFCSMKRAASLNYLNKTSDDLFQVMISLCKDLHSVFLKMLRFNLRCFFARLEGAVISGRAAASAPALWISTRGTEQQAVLFAHPKTLLLLSAAALSLSRSDRQRNHQTASTPPRASDPKTHFLLELYLSGKMHM